MNLTYLNDWAARWAPCMVRACWQGALAVAGVWVVCRLFPRIPPSLRAALWWLVCLKTLLGLVITGPLHLAVLPATAPPAAVSAPQVPAVTTPSVVAYDTSWRQAANSGAVSTAASAVSPSWSPRLPESSPVRVSLVSVAFCLWLAGVAFLLVPLCLELRAVQRLTKQAGPCAEADAVGEVALAVGLSRSPDVLVSERADCSVVVGPWRPAVVLCRADLGRLSPRELRALLAHELAHVRRRDLWAGLLPNLARLLFFFDPLVWLACREYDLAREAACDAEALRVSGLAPVDYGRLLLKLSVAPTLIPRHSGTAALSAASPYGTLLRRRLHGLRELGSGSPALPRWGSALALATALGALSLNPVRVVAMNEKRPSPPVRLLAGNHEEGSRARNNDTATLAPSQPALSPSKSLITLPVSAAKQAPLATAALSESNPGYKKEDQPMLKLPNAQKPRLATALAAVALATGTATLSAAAQEAPTTPAAPVVAQDPATPQEGTPPTTPVVPVVAPVAVPVVVPVVVPPTTQTPRYQYTLRMGNSYSNHTRDQSVASAQRELAKAQPGDCLVFDREGKRYLITDANTLRRIRENYAPLEAMGKQMETKGKQMEGIGAPMEELGKMMEPFGKRMEAIGEEMGKQGELLGEALAAGKSDAEIKAIQDKMQALQAQMQMPQEEMKIIVQKMKEYSAKMRPLGDEMRAFGTRMKVAAREAEERMTAILDAAIANNLAVEQRVP